MGIGGMESKTTQQRSACSVFDGCGDETKRFSFV